MRNDSLAGGTACAAIAVTVNIAATANSPLVNTVSVWGGGAATATKTDGTDIKK
jgi:hypothetical protein